MLLLYLELKGNKFNIVVCCWIFISVSARVFPRGAEIRFYTKITGGFFISSLLCRGNIPTLRLLVFYFGDSFGINLKNKQKKKQRPWSELVLFKL